jgi:hypothetical protein
MLSHRSWFWIIALIAVIAAFIIYKKTKTEKEFEEYVIDEEFDEDSEDEDMEEDSDEEFDSDDEMDSDEEFDEDSEDEDMEDSDEEFEVGSVAYDEES